MYNWAQLLSILIWRLVLWVLFFSAAASIGLSTFVLPQVICIGLSAFVLPQICRLFASSDDQVYLGEILLHVLVVSSVLVQVLDFCWCYAVLVLWSVLYSDDLLLCLLVSHQLELGACVSSKAPLYWCPSHILYALINKDLFCRSKKKKRWWLEVSVSMSG